MTVKFCGTETLINLKFFCTMSRIHEHFPINSQVSDEFTHCHEAMRAMAGTKIVQVSMLLYSLMNGNTEHAYTARSRVCKRKVMTSFLFPYWAVFPAGAYGFLASVSPSWGLQSGM